MSNFSDVLKYLRKREHLTQEEAATKIGISRGRLANYESGQRKPDLVTMEMIADYYNVSFSTLIGKADNSKELYEQWILTGEKEETPAVQLSHERQELIKLVMEMSDDQVNSILTLVRPLFQKEQ